MTRHGLSRRRVTGITLLEAMATMVVVALGILGVSLTVLAASKQNRRNLIQTQAGLIAEQELERIINLRCDNLDDTQPCRNIQDLDRSTRQFWWSANGTPTTTAPGAGDPPRQQFDVAVDVDPPFEGAERGAPRLDRTVAGSAFQSVINVRVTVSWPEQGYGRRAVVLQTRMSP